ncbi:MAG: YezD family protein [Treponema sp.]|nr:YezD family protein [Treponema sp.]
MEKPLSEKVRGNDRLAAIVERLATNAAGIRYGTAAVTLRVHDGRIVDITHTVTESQKEYLGP